ncbi:MAG: YwbE family protein [Methanofollis sp.]|nr:YwbE family protein [Methanofollis sp.]
MNGQHRKNIKPGITVDIVLKADQKTGKRTRGVVAAILTNSSFHPHGIKVRLRDGKVGRVQEIISTSGDQESDKGDSPNRKKC